VNIEKNTHREATMDGWKIFQLPHVRLITQRLQASGQWLFDTFCHYLLDRPIRAQCEVTPQVFVGGQFRRRGWEIIRSWGVSGVVNLRSEFDDRSLGVDIPQYLHLATIDEDAPSTEALQNGVAFIAAIIDQGGKVYIHCGAGVGRGPTMMAAYLISTGSTPEQAWKKIRQVRKFIRPTSVQQTQIERIAIDFAQ